MAVTDKNFSIIVDPDKKFNDYLARVSKKVQDLTIPYTLMTKDWFKGNRAIFSLSGKGQYADLAPDSGMSTYDYKSRKQAAVGFVYPILKRSGRLEQSMIAPGHSESVALIINKKSLILGTRVPYARYLHGGTKRMPARAVVIWAPEQVDVGNGINKRKQAWFKIVENYVDQVLKQKG